MSEPKLIIAPVTATLVWVEIHKPAGVLSIEHPGVHPVLASPRLSPNAHPNTKQLIQIYWDIEEQHPLGPSEKLVQEGLDFLRQFPSDQYVLIQCFRGKARSCAMAIGFLYVRYPEWTSSQIMETLKKIQPEAAPNILIVQMLDKILKTGGVLEQAVLADGELGANRARAHMNRRNFMEKNPDLFPTYKVG